MLALYIVVLGAEFNSASNRVTSEGGHRAKMDGLGPNTQILANRAGRLRKYWFLGHCFTLQKCSFLKKLPILEQARFYSEITNVQSRA